MVLFIYRDDMYNKETEKKGIADIYVAKHRNGPTGQFLPLFLEKYTPLRGPGGFTAMRR